MDQAHQDNEINLMGYECLPFIEQTDIECPIIRKSQKTKSAPPFPPLPKNVSQHSTLLLHPRKPPTPPLVPPPTLPEIPHDLHAIVQDTSNDPPPDPRHPLFHG